VRKRKAIYPGSFDPITNGHIDVIKRALRLFDEVIVAVALNTEKHPLFTTKERVALIKQSLKGVRGAKVADFNGLVIDFAKANKVDCMIRGLRANSDFEYEFQMALTNRHLSKEVETIFLTPSQEYFYVSSRLMKELSTFGGEISEFVPSHVEAALRQKIRR
jgi:pantetheine-phosphate adenylyltransferase